MPITDFLSRLGLTPELLNKGGLVVRSPIDGADIARLETHDAKRVDAAIGKAQEAFLQWRTVPPPKRGELVRLLGNELRLHKEDLARLITLESGKILEESRGEVQEAIDTCDMAVGQSRQLFGYTIASERPGHRMMETWHPLGVVGCITAFNFPVAVWGWNAINSLICGDSMVWKPSEKAPLCALACQNILRDAMGRFDGDVPRSLLEVVICDRDVAAPLLDDKRVPLVSATGSCRMGKEVAPRVAARLGRSLLELGGNNAMILAPSADLDLAVRAILFAAVGTAGQRCTTLRRLICHHSVKAEVLGRLKKAYGSIPVGNPMEEGILMGPLTDKSAFDAMQKSLMQARKSGTVFGGERVMVGDWLDAYYVTPAIAEMPRQDDLVRQETFAPILYVMSYEELDEAIVLHNDVPQGLSSCIFTNDVREAERFLSGTGSDCGIANVNIGPSGAEMGGAFGGEKETGGGREAGSDAWKAYMRRATNTINYSTELPLAQGIKFGGG